MKGDEENTGNQENTQELELDDDFEIGDGIFDDDDDLEQEQKPALKKAGRPKGSTTKKKEDQSSSLDSEITDIFHFAREWVSTRCESLIMRIYRANAFVADINFAESESKIKFKSLSDIQRVLGPGIYRFDLISVATRKLIIPSFRTQILDIPPELADNSQRDLGRLDRTDDILEAFQKIGGSRQSAPEIDLSNFERSTPPQQKTLMDTLKELSPLIVALAPVIKDFFGKRDQGPSRMELEEMYERKFEREQKRLKDEREYMEKKVKEMTEEKLANLGVGGSEKSVLEEAVGIAREITGVMAEKTALEKERVKLASRRPQRALAAPSGQKQKVSELTAIVTDLTSKVTSGLGQEEIVSHFKQNEAKKNAILKYSVDQIAGEVKNVLNLDEGSLGLLRPHIQEVYDSLQQ